MILLLLALFFRDPVVLVALAAVCEICCVTTLFAGSFVEMSIAVEGGFLHCHVFIFHYCNWHSWVDFDRILIWIDLLYLFHPTHFLLFVHSGVYY